LSSDALPLLPPAVGAFDTRQFRLFSADAEFLGTIDTLTCTAGCAASAVPAPGTLWLLGLGMTGLLLRRRPMR